MPIAAAVIPAVIGAGAAIYSSSQSKKAANQANDAQQQAAAQQLAAQQANFDRISTLNQPFVSGGQGAYAQLLSRYGIGPQGGAAPGSTPNAGNPAPSGGPDWQAYWNQNPDLAINNAATPTTDLTGDGKIDNQDRAAEHWQEFGRSEGRPLPTAQVAPQPAPAPPAPAVVDPNAAPDLMNARRPDMGPGPAAIQRQDVGMQDYGPAPTIGDYGSAPDLGSYFQNFEADPGAQYRRDQALDSVNARSAVRGKLRSGDAALALAKVGSDLGSQEYNNWFSRQQTKFGDAQGQFDSGRNFALSKYNTDQNAYSGARSFAGNMWQAQQGRADANAQNDRAYNTSMWQYGNDKTDANFNADRAYQTGRSDTQTGNLFNLTDIGLRAAGNVSGAGTNFANASSNIYGSQANATADAANARANANTGMVGAIGGQAQNLFQNWGGNSGANTNYANMANSPVVTNWNGRF